MPDVEALSYADMVVMAAWVFGIWALGALLYDTLFRRHQR